METFETFTIDTSTFFELTLIDPLKISAGLFVALFILWAISEHSFGVKDIGPAKNVPYSILLLFKTVFYGVLFSLVFFYDFSASKYVLKLPQRISLNSAFVGILSAYESITGFISVFLPFFKKG